MTEPLYDAIDGEELKIIIIDEVVKALNNCGFLTRGLAFPILHKCQIRIHLEIAEDLIPIREAIHERRPKPVPEGVKPSIHELTAALPEQIGELVAPDKLRIDHQIPLASTSPETLLTVDERVETVKGWLKDREKSALEVPSGVPGTER